MYSWNTAPVCEWKLFWFQADEDQQHPVPVFCPSWGSGWGDEASATLPGVGAGDALRLHISPPPASAAPCWHTGHSGDRPAHSRAWGGDHIGCWLQTLPGTLRCTQVHPGTPRYTQVHPGTPRYTQVHSGTPRCTQVHPGTPRYTQVHSGAPRWKTYRSLKEHFSEGF